MKIFPTIHHVLYRLYCMYNSGLKCAKSMRKWQFMLRVTYNTCKFKFMNVFDDMSNTRAAKSVNRELAIVIVNVKRSPL